MDRFGRWCSAVLLAAVCGAALAQGVRSGAGQAVAPASPTTAELVGRVVKHPRDEGPWKELGKPERRAEAKRLLVAAFKDPTNALPDQGGLIKPEGGRDDILEAIARIFWDDAADTLVEAVKDDDARVRYTAVLMLGWREMSATAKTRAAVRGALHDKDAGVVIAALGTIGRHPDAEAGPEVLELLRRPPVVVHTASNPRTTYSDGYVVRDGFDETMEAIGATGYAGAVADLLALTRDSSAHVRAHAATALGLCAKNAEAGAREEAVRQLRSLTGDANHAVWLAAAEALADYRDPTAVAPLMFEARTATRPLEKDDYRDRVWLKPVVEALEKITGEDLGSGQGDDKFWEIDQSERGFPEKLTTLAPLVKHIEERVAARKLPADGFPILPTKLSDADKAMLDRGFKNWLVDPRGGTYIEFEREGRTSWGATNKYQTRGWLFPAAEGKPARAPTFYE